MGLLIDFVKEVRRAGGSLIAERQMRRRLAKARAECTRDVAVESLQLLKNTVSVVVPCYGHSEYIDMMVQSIAAQTLPPQEVIFVNDHSPDATQAQLEESVERTGLKKLTHCTIISNEQNLGQAASLNIAIEAADSELVMVLNDDDYLFHDAVEVSVKMLKEHHSIRMLGAQCIPIGDDREIQLYHKELLKVWEVDTIPLKIFQPDDVQRYRKLNDLNITHSGCTFYKRAWQVAGGYRTEKNERIVPFSDRDFQLRFNLYFPIGIMNIPISFWRHNSSVDAGINS